MPSSLSLDCVRGLYNLNNLFASIALGCLMCRKEGSGSCRLSALPYLFIYHKCHIDMVPGQAQ